MLPWPHDRRGWPGFVLPTGEERLARLAAGGNEQAFRVLYERYHRSLYRYCRSILNNDSDAQDALQSSFANAYAALTRGQRDAPLRPWLYRIAHNESVSIMRRRRPHLDVSESCEQLGASLEDQVESRHRVAALFADLSEMPERQRGALLMRELCGLSHEEIGLALDISVGAAKQAVFEARQRLLEFAHGRDMACEQVQRALSDGDRRRLRGGRVRAHIRDCPDCQAFAVAIRTCDRELLALAPPLPAAAAAAILARVLQGSSAVSGGGAGGGSSLIGASAGKFAGTTVAVKGLAAAAILAGSAVGIVTIAHRTSARANDSPGAVRAARAVAAPAATGVHANGAVSRSARPASHAQLPGPPQAGHRAPGVAASGAAPTGSTAAGGAAPAQAGSSAAASGQPTGAQHPGPPSGRPGAGRPSAPPGGHAPSAAGGTGAGGPGSAGSRYGVVPASASGWEPRQRQRSQRSGQSGSGLKPRQRAKAVP